MKCVVGAIIVCLLISTAGCTNVQLRTATLEQGSTLTEFQYQMILRNLATLAANPAIIPWHTSIVSGTAQVADSGTAHSYFLPQFAPRLGNRWFEWESGVSGSRTVVEQWSTNPIIHTDALKVIQMAYRRAFGFPDMPDQDLLDDISHDIKKQISSTEDLRSETALFYQSQYVKLKQSYDSLRRATNSTVGGQRIMPGPGEPDPDADRRSPLAREVAREVNDIVDDLRTIPSGWFGIGCKRDVPKDACYVARNGKVYVWVTKEHCDELSRFTMTVLDIATAIQEPQMLSVQGGGLSFSPGYAAPP
jgi:hypothetical protein